MHACIHAVGAGVVQRERERERRRRKREREREEEERERERERAGRIGINYTLLETFESC